MEIGVQGELFNHDTKKRSDKRKTSHGENPPKPSDKTNIN